MTSKGVKGLEELAITLRQWQQIEALTIAHTHAISQQTRNPLVRLIMEIIRQDSHMHTRVQQAILDSLEKEAFSLTHEELGEVWEMIEKHAQMEKETIALGEKALANCGLFVQSQLLAYLLADEKKHDRLLAQLGDLKRKM
jgi:hypothetical protein